MTTPMTDKELMQQALEALSDYIPMYDKRMSTITALREALAEQPAPAPDPDELTIAYMSGVYEGKKAERKPLPLDKDGWWWVSEDECIWGDVVRKVEAAHGITKGNT